MSITKAFGKKYVKAYNIGKGAYGVVVRTVCGHAIKWVQDCKDTTEIIALEACRHPNVVALVESVEYEGDLYIVMEAWSMSMFQIWNRPITMDYADWALLQIVSGLAHIHSKGYLHRDLKPSNILVDHEKICIADFGHATFYRSSAEAMTRTMLTDKVFTRWYRPPEVTLLLPYDESADMFSLGCIYVELVRHALKQQPRPLFQSDQSFPLSGDFVAENEHLQVLWRVLAPTEEERLKLTMEPEETVKYRQHKQLLNYVDSLPKTARLELGFPVLQTARVYAMVAYDPSARLSAESMREWCA